MKRHRCRSPQYLTCMIKRSVLKGLRYKINCSTNFLETKPLMGACISRQIGSRTDENLPSQRRRRLSITTVNKPSAVHEDEHSFERGCTGVLISKRRRLSLMQVVENNSEKAVRLSIGGRQTRSYQPEFANKHASFAGNIDKDELTKLGIGYCCKKGLKPESPNQDDFFIYAIGETFLFGIFDGHGAFGEVVSNFVQSTMAGKLWEHPMFYEDLHVAIKDVFREIQADLVRQTERRSINANLSGCTGSLIVWERDKNLLTCAYVGDSRVVLGYYDSDEVNCKELTIDHKPINPGELKRIEETGGVVRRIPGDIPYRVYVKGASYPGLAMSRALGDTMATKAGVIAEPDILSYELDKRTRPFLIGCSDGVWEFITNEEAVNMVAKSIHHDPSAAAEALAIESWNRWLTEEGDVVDDITVEIMDLYGVNQS